MGLDITAYSHLTYVGHCPDSDEDEHRYDPETYEVRHVDAYAYKEFPHALMGMPNVRPSHRHESFITAGCFAVTEKTEVHKFQAGSYTGYNRWREDLAQFCGNPERRPEGWFYELIWFADNEGVLGEMAAIKLLGQFRQFEVEYRTAHLGTVEGDYYVAKYADWTRAFQLAADGGLVDFH